MPVLFGTLLAGFTGLTTFLACGVFAPDETRLEAGAVGLVGDFAAPPEVASFLAEVAAAVPSRQDLSALMLPLLGLTVFQIVMLVVVVHCYYGRSHRHYCGEQTRGAPEG